MSRRLTDKTVAVTGATGFLGSHIALGLIDAGAHVVGVVRSPEKGAWLAEQGVELRRADLADAAALAAGFEGADAVVSNAALGSWGGDLDTYLRVNGEGTENVLDALGSAGVRRLVHISTVAVYRTRLMRWMDEDAEPYGTVRRRINPSDLTTDWRYALSKSLAERAVWERATDLDITVLRPGPIYGSRDPKLSASYLERLGKRVVLAPTVRVPHVHAGDVGRAVAAALASPAAVGRAYNVTGPPVSPYTILRTLRRLRGRGPFVVPVPVPAWVGYDNGAAARDLGFVPRSLGAGLREVLAGG